MVLTTSPWWSLAVQVPDIFIELFDMRKALRTHFLRCSLRCLGSVGRMVCDETVLNAGWCEMERDRVYTGPEVSDSTADVPPPPTPTAAPAPAVAVLPFEYSGRLCLSMCRDL